MLLRYLLILACQLLLFLGYFLLYPATYMGKGKGSNSNLAQTWWSCSVHGTEGKWEPNGGELYTPENSLSLCQQFWRLGEEQAKRTDYSRLINVNMFLKLSTSICAVEKTPGFWHRWWLWGKVENSGGQSQVPQPIDPLHSRTRQLSVFPGISCISWCFSLVLVDVGEVINWYVTVQCRGRIWRNYLKSYLLELDRKSLVVL